MTKFLLTVSIVTAALLAAPHSNAAAVDSFVIQMLSEPGADQSISNTSAMAIAAIVRGDLDSQFKPLAARDLHDAHGSLWLRLQKTDDSILNDTSTVAANLSSKGGSNDVMTLNVRKNRRQAVEVFATDAAPLRLATTVPGFRGQQNAVFLFPDEFHNGLAVGQSLYVHVDAAQSSGESLHFSTDTLTTTLASAADHARMISITFGALMAMALSALLVWFVLKEKLLLLYGLLFSLQAIYIAFLSGQGFDWPVLSAVLPLEAYASKVPAGLSGAIACLFIREIAELERYSPRVYRIFGWLALSFVVVTVANIAQEVGLGGWVAMIGNLLFVGAGLFTLVVAFLAWRRKNRAAGWFLIAWALLETFTIATAIRLLIGTPENSVALLYYGLPLSMIAAAVLVALGVADRLRDQRRALGDAERRAQIDPLTGVLNRRSLADRLEAACIRAQARDLPIALLFIDLDHFKQINDTYNHAAGDACLKAVVAPIQAELRQSDVIGRYGGEEFVVILSSADIASAQPIAERIRKRVADVSIEGFGPPIRITCSIGVASSDMLGIWGDQLITRADQAVYKAKRSGRNCVQIAEPIPA